MDHTPAHIPESTTLFLNLLERFENNGIEDKYAREEMFRRFDEEASRLVLLGFVEDLNRQLYQMSPNFISCSETGERYTVAHALLSKGRILLYLPVGSVVLHDFSQTRDLHTLPEVMDGIVERAKAEVEAILPTLSEVKETLIGTVRAIQSAPSLRGRDRERTDRLNLAKATLMANPFLTDSFSLVIPTTEGDNLIHTLRLPFDRLKRVDEATRSDIRRHLFRNLA